MNRLVTGVLLLCAMATGEAQTTSEDHKCSGYFCDKFIHEIVITMTHNSLSHKRGGGRNQIGNLVKQFKDGVRGFNFDLYPCPSGRTCKKDMWHKHGCSTCQAYDPYDQIRDLRDELQLDKWRNEIIVIQLQGDGRNGGKSFLRDVFDGMTMLPSLYGSGTPLEDDINRNERVYIQTTGSSLTSICENTYKWYTSSERMPVERRENLRDSDCTVLRSGGASPFHPVLLMNSFIGGWRGTLFGRENAMHANKECRLIENARRFAESGNYGSSPRVKVDDDDDYSDDYSNGEERAYPNIIMVDFYQEGEVFRAQQCLRSNDRRCIDTSC